MPDLFYTSVDAVYDLEPDIGSVAALTSAQIVTAHAQPAEALINATIAPLYVVPIVPAPAILASIAADLTVYRILSRRMFSQQQLKASTWPLAFKEAMDTLTNLADGSLLIYDTSGQIIPTRTDEGQAVSNTMGYRPTFDEGRPDEWWQDYWKVNDIENSKIGTT